MTERPRVLLLGNAASPEMEPVRVALGLLLPDSSPRHAADAQAAATLIHQEGWHPDLVVVCQEWPDEYAPSDVGRLIALAPLARWVCCHGAWCASDGRSRDLWPLGIRVPASWALFRLQRELAVLAGDRPPLPLTASRDEAFAFDAADAPPACDRPLRVLVRAADGALAGLMRDLVESIGCTAIVPPADDCPAQSADVIVCDLDPWNSRRIAAELGRDRTRCGFATPVIGLMGQPWPGDTDAANELGIGRLVSKLAAPEDLPLALAEIAGAAAAFTGESPPRAGCGS